MDAELEKLVEAGKLGAAAAENLDQLKPGTFCLHKSWGFGRVAEWNLLLNQIVIDFVGKKGQAMQLPYAAEHLTPLDPGHFLARKAVDLDSVKKLAKEAPASLVRNILESLGGKATQLQISQWLLGDVFAESEFKRWWDSTKKLLKSEGHFLIPVKKNEPVQLRSEPVSRANELITFFNQARQLKEQAAALDQIVKFRNEFDAPEVQLQPIINAIEDAASRNQRLNPALVFELMLARDDLLTHFPKLQTSRSDLSLARLIAEEETRLETILPKMPAGKERRVLEALPAALGPRWTTTALRLMQSKHARSVSQIPRIFAQTGEQPALRFALERSIREHSATSEILLWLCKERADEWRGLITPELLGAILSALERDQHNETSRGNKLRDLLLDDRELIADMFVGVEASQARDAMRRLMVSPAFDELTKRSLLARIIKLYPELESILTGGDQADKKTEALVVSWSSLHKRKAEYEDLVKRKIPENTREIALARSYGDLSENFEYKAAKQMQAVLMRRKTELEQALHNARGTAFESPDTSRVSIGTVVTLRDEASSKEETYTILGAWDGDPERHIISYQTAIGQTLLGHALGEVVTLNTDHGTSDFAIISIEAAPRDETPPDPSLTETLAEPVEV